MDFDLEEALRLFPLPDGMPDDVMTLGELAQALDISEPTIKRYIQRGMPVASHGGNGRAYEMRLSECWAWKNWVDREEVERRRKVSETIGQMRMLFRNDQDQEPGGEHMSARQIAEESDAEIKRLKAAQLRGELLPTDRVRDALERALVGFRNGMITLPDFAEIELGLGPEDVDKLQSWVDGVLNDLELRLGDAVGPEGSVLTLSAEIA